MLALALLSACADPAAEDAETASTETASTETASTDTANTDTVALVAPEPAWDAATAAARAQGLLDPGLPDAALALRDWRGLFEGATPPCPGITGDFSIASPFEGCLAADGRTWAGYAVYTEGHASPVDLGLEADAYVTLTDGTTFLAGGKTYLTLEETGEFASTVVGTWGGSNLDDWTGPRPSVAVYATGTATSATFYGGVSVGQDAVYLSHGTWDAASCRGATGEIDIRDPGGWWYRLELDADCGGCGTMRYEEEDLGSACLDLEPILEAFVARVWAP